MVKDLFKVLSYNTLQANIAIGLVQQVIYKH